MRHKQLFFHSAALEKILRGASTLADAVRVTLLALLAAAGCTSAAPTPPCGIHASSPAPPSAGWHWTTLPNLREARQNAMAAEFDGAMYVFGGFGSASDLLSTVERYDPATNTWTAAPAMPTVQCCAGAARVGSEIAVVGGYLPDVSAVSQRMMLFNPSRGTWRDGPPMPTARANVMVAQWNGLLAVIGGRTTQGAHIVTGLVELYDPVSETWSTSPLTITPREAGVAISDGTQVVVAGGYTQAPLDAPPTPESLYGAPIVEVLDTSGVVQAPNLLMARGQFGGGCLSGAIITAGGWSPMGDSAWTEVLVGARTEWQQAPDMPTARSGVVAAVVGGKLVVAGGAQFRLHDNVVWQQLATVEALVP